MTGVDSNGGYCIRLYSGDNDGCPDTHYGSWKGDNISIFHNGVKKATAYEYFENFEFCLPYNDIDIQNDLIELKNGGPDGVSTSIFSGYIDVGDRCRRRDMLVTTLRCW